MADDACELAKLVISDWRLYISVNLVGSTYLTTWQSKRGIRFISLAGIQVFIKCLPDVVLYNTRQTHRACVYLQMPISSSAG